MDKTHILLGAGFAVVAALLVTIAYQVNRTTWSPDDQACHGIFSASQDEDRCRADLKDKAKLQDAMDRIAAAAAEHR